MWAEKWQDATDAYRQALAEFPDHDSALMGYAWALLNAEDLDQALQVYERLTDLLPKDPSTHRRDPGTQARAGSRGHELPGSGQAL